jgi:hypothetical protein
MLRFHTQRDDLFRVTNEGADRIGDLDDLIGDKQPLQIGDYLWWRIVATAQHYISPRKCCLGSFGEYNAASVVSNIGHQFFGETGLTGQVESNLKSKPTLIYVRIT